MSYANSLKQHIVEHQILGIKSGSGGSIDGLKAQAGRLWVYDTVRTRWLSTDRATFPFAKSGRAKNMYLYLIDGQSSDLAGYILPRNATLTAISARTRNNETWTLEVRKNNVVTPIATLGITSSSGGYTTSVNVDLNAGDRLEAYANTTAILGISNPSVWLEIAWRTV